MRNAIDKHPNSKNKKYLVENRRCQQHLKMKCNENEEHLLPFAQNLCDSLDASFKNILHGIITDGCVSR